MGSRRRVLILLFAFGGPLLAVVLVAVGAVLAVIASPVVWLINQMGERGFWLMVIIGLVLLLIFGTWGANWAEHHDREQRQRLEAYRKRKQEEAKATQND